MTTLPPDDLLTQLLDRVALMCVSYIPAIQDASPELWDTPTGQKFPVIFLADNGGNSILDGSSYEGAPFFSDTINITLRLLVGGASAGFTSQMERTVKSLTYAIINMFRQYPYLDDPNAPHKAFPYINPRLRARITTWQRVTVFQYDTKNNFMGREFNLAVDLLTQKGRKS